MSASNILDQINVQYVKVPQTLKDIVNTCIPLNATKVFSTELVHGTLDYMTDTDIYSELESCHHWINDHVLKAILVWFLDCVNKHLKHLFYVQSATMNRIELYWELHIFF